MTRAIVEQKLRALESAEVRLDRTLRESATFPEIWEAYLRAEDDYNEAFDVWWNG
jgi:hypothetical protein